MHASLSKHDMHTTRHTMLQLAGEGEAQEGPGRPRRAQERSGEPRRAQEGPGDTCRQHPSFVPPKGRPYIPKMDIYGLIRYVHMDIFETFRAFLSHGIKGTMLCRQNTPIPGLVRDWIWGTLFRDWILPIMQH